MTDVRYEVSPVVSDDALNELFAAAWTPGLPAEFGPVHEHSLVHLCAYEDERLVGYVRVAWDGSVHGFLLEPTVHPDVQRRGIGTELVRRAAALSRERGMQWLHVDFAPELQPFYDRCGFVPTRAGLIDLS